MERMAVVERYRKTALLMRKRGIPVTKATLAKRLRRSTTSVTNTVNRRAWRAYYIGVESRYEVKRRAYRDAAIALGKNGTIPKSVLAKHLGVTMRAVQSYLKKHPDVFDGLDVTVLGHHQYAFAHIRYRNAAARVRASGHPLTRKMLAYELGIKFAGVCTYLRSHPQLAEELGVVFTSDID
jgi:hypothetical protein